MSFRPHLTSPSSNYIDMFIGGLHPETTLSQLYESLSSSTSIKNLKLIRDRKTGLNKGYAFFKVSDLQTASQLLSKDIIVRQRQL